MEGFEHFIENYIAMHGVARLIAGLLAWSVVNTLLAVSLMFRASSTEKTLEGRKNP